MLLAPLLLTIWSGLIEYGELLISPSCGLSVTVITLGRCCSPHDDVVVVMNVVSLLNPRAVGAVSGELGSMSVGAREAGVGATGGPVFPTPHVRHEHKVFMYRRWSNRK